MNQSKIEQLKQHLKSAVYKGHKLALPEQFDSNIETGIIIPASKIINGNGILAARLTYRGIISIDPCLAPPILVCAYVSFWLQNNATEQDANAFEFNVERIDNTANEIEIVIDAFSEDITLIESEQGAFDLMNQRYDFGEQSLWVADHFELEGQIHA